MRILFLHQHLSTFVKKDLDTLRLHHSVRELHFRGAVDLSAVWQGVVWCDLSFSWFGKLHAFFAVLFSKFLRKQAVVVSGGDDVACEPEINYGLFTSWWKKWCPLFVFRYADLILNVSEFNRHEAIANAQANPATAKLLYHGFDAERFRPLPQVNKERLVITVGGVDWERLERKGYERFVRAASYLPKVRFALIGQSHDGAIDHLRKMAPDNVMFPGRVSDDGLLSWLSRAKVYVQASVHEAFGCSLAEAMLCECVPVVSRRAALSEVTGDCGFYVDDLKPRLLAAQIEKALASDLGHRARQRIVCEFPMAKRQAALLAAVEEVMGRD